MSYQNIIVYFVWIAVIMGFFLVNIALIIDKNSFNFLLCKSKHYSISN
ncbi:DUF443 domain-containing protein, partial [Staphylococcus aureus]|nr:DUF443 domain-containing protein [Staphylococcus aureus]